MTWNITYKYDLHMNDVNKTIQYTLVFVRVYDQQNYKMFNPKTQESAQNVENSVLVRSII